MKNSSFYAEPWFSEVHPDRNELVFENRHRSYGAYQIRREYDNAVIFAFLLSAGIVLAGFSLPLLYKYLFGASSEIFEKPDTTIVCELDLRDVIEIPVEVPAVRPAEIVKARAVSSFTVPEITDKKFTEVEPIDLNESGKRVEGDPDPKLTGKEIDFNDKPAVKEILEDPAAPPVLMAQVMPSFVGGEDAMRKWISTNIKYSEEAKLSGLSGTVYIGFIIDREGNVTDAKILRGIRGGRVLEDEALRVIQAMPQWKPGRNNGHPVRVSLVLPLTFSLK